MSVPGENLVSREIVVAEDPRGGDAEVTGDEVNFVGGGGAVPVLEPADGLAVEADGFAELFLRQVPSYAEAVDAVPNPGAVVLEPGVELGHIATLEWP
ncbi:hypothetical protein ABH932_000584 [Streptacidiphilus sp. MAP5-52]